MSPRDRIDMWNKVWNNFAVVLLKKNKNVSMSDWFWTICNLIREKGRRGGEEKFTLNAY